MSSEQPLITHLIELRNRILRVIAVIFILFIILVYFSNDIYHLVSKPLLDALPQGSSMIATQVVAPFFTPIKLTLIVSLFLSVPYLLYQTWAFIAPALYQHEKRLIYPLLISSSLLFYLGVAFAYYIVFPLAFGFLTATAPEGVAIATDITSYLDFVLTIFLAFGACFEVPVAIVLLVSTGTVSAESLRKKRSYIIVLAFIIGMVLTPPDVFSQTLLAIPMILLFEIGLFFSKYYEKRLSSDEKEDETSADEDAKQEVEK